jgi:hypothetical protein
MADQRGRRIFLVLATITLMVKLGGVLPMIDGYERRISKLIAVVIALSVAFLWRGNALVQRVAAGAFLLSGAMTLLDFVRSLEALDLYGFGVAFRLFLGVVDVLAGLAILFQPDLIAFFRHQRNGMPHQFLKSAPLSRNRQVMTACVWGLVLGGWSGILLTAQWAQSIEVAVIFEHEAREDLKLALTGLLSSVLLGLIAGLLVGMASPDASLTIKRLAVKRGLRVAVFSVVAGIVLSAIHGFFFAAASSGFPISRGWQSAGIEALVFAVVGTPVVGPVAFVLGAVIALLLADGRETETGTRETETGTGDVGKRKRGRNGNGDGT